jgi:outer membrane protein OmpA-like peptidoglycan-associated protein
MTLSRWRLGVLATAILACTTGVPRTVVTSRVSPVASQPADLDGDGLADDVDLCPDIAEDCDGFEDENGCPDPDNDHDGVLDACDACPVEAGAPPDGCPPRVVVNQAEIRIMPRVLFGLDTARLEGPALTAIDAIAETLRREPRALRVEVSGHANQRERNRRQLAQRHAEVVLEALVARGIEASRLVARGYDADRPLMPETTEEGRARNRRVDFVVLEFEPAPEAPPRPRVVLPAGCPDAAPPPLRGPCRHAPKR